MYRLYLLFWTHSRDATVNQAFLNGSTPIVIANVRGPGERNINNNFVMVLPLAVSYNLAKGIMYPHYCRFMVGSREINHLRP